MYCKENLRFKNNLKITFAPCQCQMSRRGESRERMSGTKELEIDVEIPEDDLHGGALDVLKVLRPGWKQKDVKFLVSFAVCSRSPHPFQYSQTQN